MLRFKTKGSWTHHLKSLFFIFIASICLTSCNVPEEIDTISENTVQSVGKVGNEIGKERRVNKDVLIAPEQEEKIQIRF